MTKRDNQLKRHIGIKAGDKIVDTPNRPFGLNPGRFYCVRRVGAGGIDKRLERVRSLLLDLFQRREIADRRVEAVEGGESVRGRAACGTERALQGRNMAPQFVEFRVPQR